MRGKRAQLAIFVIAALVVLSIFLIVYFTAGSIAKNRSPTLDDNSKKSAESYVESCLFATSKNAVFLAGRYGGYIYQSNVDFTDTAFGSAVYLYKFNEEPTSYLLTIPEIESQISAYVENEIGKCIDFSEFESRGYAVITGAPAAKTTIRDNTVIVELEYPVVMRKDSSEWKSSDYRTTVNVRLGLIHARAQEIISAITESDLEGPLDIGEESLPGATYRLISSNPKFSYSFIFSIKETGIKVDYSFMPDAKSTFWVIYDDKANPGYMFMFASEHRKVI
jgi:hypothetical protein